jgi:diguanylate cyclase (GGDEF)-like protein
LIQIIAKHPWSSLRDALVLAGVMTFAVLIALHYDLFEFIAALADPERGISPAEAVVLTVMLGVGIYVFVGRRLKEERWDEAAQERLQREVTELRELAMQDPLTQLPNRRALLDALQAATETYGPGCPQHAVFLLDLNDFKNVNDRYGHAVGDRVLQVVVERFRRVTRPSDLLARLGGDEFAVLSCDIDKRAAQAIGERFAAVLTNDIAAEGHLHRVGVSIGAALFPADGTTRDTILRNADLAMYRAKGEESASVVFYDPIIDTTPAEREAAG